MVEQCYRTQKTMVNPIIDWENDDVWEFIREREMPYCSLYDEGFARLGCVGCPLCSDEHRRKDFERWPQYKALYINAFDEMLKERAAKGKQDGMRKWKDAQSVFDWWLQNMKIDTNADQTTLDMEDDNG